MTLPGQQVISRTLPPSRSAPTATDALFVTGLTEKGSAADAQTPITSLTEYVRRFGARVTYGVLYDALDAFFRDGGARAFISRVTGPAALVAGVTLNDGSAAASLRVAASSPGDWGNLLNVQVLAGSGGGTFVLKITHDTDTSLVYTSPDLADQAAAVAWAQSIPEIDITILTSTNDPAVVGVTSLTGGTDDRGAVTEQNWTDALARFGTDLGPGQVAAPGRTTAAAYTALLDHAASRNRLALLDLADTSDESQLIASAAGQRGLTNARYGAAFAPWVQIPGLTAGTTRTVPPSVVAAARMARNDARGLNANIPAAGDNGVSDYAIGLSQVKWTDAEREQLNDGGVNVLLSRFGAVTIYGFRTLVDPIAAPDWLQLSNARLNMAVAAEAGVIAERYVFAQLDGRRLKVGQFGGDLSGMLLGFYEVGALYGASPEEAFVVDVGPGVNPDSDLAAGILRAVLSLRMSPFGERVIVEIVKVKADEVII